MKKAKINVLDHDWQAILRSDRVHKKEFPKTHGITILEDRKFYLRKSSLTLTSIIHEIVHAYQQELSYWELDLDEDQVEEWFCELFAKYGEKIIKDAKELCQKLT